MAHIIYWIWLRYGLMQKAQRNEMDCFMNVHAPHSKAKHDNPNVIAVRMDDARPLSTCVCLQGTAILQICDCARGCRGMTSSYAEVTFPIFPHRHLLVFVHFSSWTDEQIQSTTEVKKKNYARVNTSKSNRCDETRLSKYYTTCSIKSSYPCRLQSDKLMKLFIKAKTVLNKLV
jgi:hypothetical protein